MTLDDETDGKLTDLRPSLPYSETVYIGCVVILGVMVFVQFDEAVPMCGIRPCGCYHRLMGLLGGVVMNCGGN